MKLACEEGSILSFSFKITTMKIFRAKGFLFVFFGSLEAYKEEEDYLRTESRSIWAQHGTVLGIIGIFGHFVNR